MIPLLERFLAPRCALAAVLLAGLAWPALAQGDRSVDPQPSAELYRENPFISVGPLVYDVRGGDSQIPTGWRYDELTAARPGADPYRLVKVTGPVGATTRKRIAATGAEIVGYLPYNTFVVRLTDGQRDADLNDAGGVEWVGIFEPYFKIGPELDAAWRGGDVAGLTGSEEWGLRFNLVLHPGEARAAAEDLVAGIAGVRLLPSRGPLRVAIEPTDFVAALPRLAALPAVAAIEAWRRARTFNDENVQSGQSGSCVNNSGNEGLNTTIFNRGLTGWNARLAVADSCTDANEGWFYDTALARLPAHEPSAPWTSAPADFAQRKLLEYYDMYSGDTTLGCGGASGCTLSCPDHGTHVTGTMAGNCNTDAEGLATQTMAANSSGDQDGMAPGALLVAQDMGNGTLDYLNVDGGTLGELVSVAYNNTCDGGDCGIDAHNNSWGAPTDQYTTDSRAGDNQLWLLEDLIVAVAMGNDGSGFGTVGAPATAKNVVSVGSSLNCSTVNMTGSSSRGDTRDGRLKPDVVAGGDGVTSARNDGSSPNSNDACSTLTIGGTSMATPTVVGLSALALQYFNDGFYPTGSATPADALDPSGRLMKALLVNSAQPMTGTGADQSSGGVGWPNMDQGFGFLNLENSLFFPGDSRNLWLHDEATGVDAGGAGNGVSMDFSRRSTDPSEPLKVTLVWYDTQGSVNCNPCLVNDLDLTVTDESTSTVYTVTRIADGSGHQVPRTVVPASPGAGQTTTDNGPDTRNTVEQVIIYNPPLDAEFTINVRATSTPDGPIPFAVVVTGATADPCTPPAGASGLAASATQANQIDLSWTASPAPGVTEYRIYRGTSSGGPYTQVGSVGGATLSFSDTTVSGGTTYFYVVRAVVGCESADSNEASATAFGDCTLPPSFAGIGSVQPISAGSSCGLRLTWPTASNACGGEPVVYNVYRSTSPGFTPGAGNLLQACVPDTFVDDTTALNATTYHYVVRAEDAELGGGGSCRDGNEDANAVELSGVAGGTGTTMLYSNDFETGSGLDDWSVGLFGGAATADWRGIQTCAPAASGTDIFRFGGVGCTADYSNNNFRFAEPDPNGGGGGVTVPASATNVRLTFSHRRQLESGFDGGTLAASLDGSGYTLVPASAITGTSYNGNVGNFCPVAGTAGIPIFTGSAPTMSSTEVDLDAVCDLISGGSGGCAGQDVRVAFTAISDCSVTQDGWFLDDVEITADEPNACNAPPGAVQFLTATARDGENIVEWLNPTAGVYATTRIRFRTDTFPTDPADGTLLVDQNDGIGQKGSFTHSALTNGTTYYYAAFVDDGSGDYSGRKTVSSRPFDTSGPAKWAYSTGASALAPPGIGSVYGAANDRVLHSMDTTGGLGAGTWPAPWRPLAMNGPAQDRPPVLPISLGAATKVTFLGSHDGRVYAVDADSGGQLWASPQLAPLVQAAPVVMTTQFGSPHDLVMVGSRDGSAANSFVGLQMSTGTVAWEFTNSVPQGGDGSGLGIISGTASLDLAASRVYFASRRRAGGSSDTVWCLSFTGGSATRLWSRDLGDVDGSPILLGNRLYVGTNGGEVHALDAATGASLWAAPFATGDGPVKGYVWPRFGTPELLVSTTTRVWSLIDNGATVSLDWSLSSIPGPAVPLTSPSEPLAWIGSSDGSLYQLDLAGPGTPTVTSLALGTGTAAVGSPALDVFNSRAYVGTEDGKLYAVELPLP